MNRRTFIRTTAATSLALTQTGNLFALEAENAYRKISASSFTHSAPNWPRTLAAL